MDERLRNAERRYQATGLYEDYLHVLKEILRSKPEALNRHELIRAQLLTYFDFYPAQYNHYTQRVIKLPQETWEPEICYNLIEEGGNDHDLWLPMQFYHSKYFRNVSFVYDLYLLATPGLFSLETDHLKYDIVVGFSMGIPIGNPPYSLRNYLHSSGDGSNTLYVDSDHQVLRVTRHGVRSQAPYQVGAIRPFEDIHDIQNEVIQLFTTRDRIITNNAARFIQEGLIHYLMDSPRNELSKAGYGLIFCHAVYKKTEDGFVPVQILDGGANSPQFAEVQIKFQLSERPDSWSDRAVAWRFRSMAETPNQQRKADYILKCLHHNYRSKFSGPQYVEWEQGT